jgi:hypothetical protein
MNAISVPEKNPDATKVKTIIAVSVMATKFGCGRRADCYGAWYSFIPEGFCGAKEIRTPDLFNAIEALYQLSYNPIFV